MSNDTNATGSAIDTQNETVSKLLDLLQRVERLGLTFARGSAYISAGYIREQTKLRAEIDEAFAAFRSDKP